MKPEWLKVTVRDSTAVVEFTLTPTQSITHDELAPAVGAVYEALKDAKIETVLITGRGPTWLYSAIVHTVAHLAKAVLVYDAVNKTYVVTVSHSPSYKIGATIPPEKLV